MEKTSNLRQESIKTALSEIRKCDGISKRELQAITGFSWGKISTIITFLVNENFIKIIGKQKTSAGRRPETFDINTEDNYIIGIDFNSEGALVAVCDLRGRIVKRYTTHFAIKEKQSVIDNLLGLLERVVKALEGKKIYCIALAMQGEVDVEAGVSVKISALKDWRDVPICNILQRRFGIKTIIMHDPDCLLYVKKQSDTALRNKIKNAILLRIDYDIGIAAMLGGKIYMGNRNKTCEIGTVVVPTENGYEKLNKIANERAVRARYFEIANKRLKCSEIAKLARDGGKTEKDLFSDLGRALGFALNSAISLFNPEKIIFYGDFIKYNDLFLEDTKRVLEQLHGEDVPMIEISSLDEAGAAIGAALFAADGVVKELIFKNTY